jgi:hypothetical protein
VVIQDILHTFFFFFNMSTHEKMEGIDILHT